MARSPRGSAAQRQMGPGNDASPSSSSSKGAQQRDMPEDTGSSEPDDGDILEEALRRADEAYWHERDNITEGRACQRFYAAKGQEQWDEKAISVRTRDGRPILQINRLPQFVRQVTGDLRKNPPELKFLPAKEGASQDAAEALNGIKRNIDAQSNGKDCYVIATENAAIAGQGAWVLTTEHEDDDSFNLVIRKKPLRDPFGFLDDPFAVEPDRSDRKYAFIYDTMSIHDFQDAYPGKAPIDMPNSPSDSFPWRRGDSIRIAEYWKREIGQQQLHMLADGTTTTDLQAASMDGTALTPIRSRTVAKVAVRYWIMNGQEILDGPIEWAGIYIPLCVVTGEEITMDAVTVRKGMVHDARDPQRIYNYSRSASVEAVALQPKAPFIATVDQIRNFEDKWQTAGSKNHSVLPYNPDPRAPGPPQRSQPPIASQGLDSQAMIAASDMEAVLGIYKPSLGAPSNETSGRAIMARQNEGDTGTFLYHDNLARAIGYEGKVLADLIPKIYDSERIVRILKEDGTADLQKINPQMNALGMPMNPEPQQIDPNTGQPLQPKPLIQLNAGKYDVVVTTGPSFATRRVEAWANMVELARAYPPLMQIAGDLVLKNADFPGADEIAKRIEDAIGIQEDGTRRQPPPNPKDIASAAKDASSADLTQAETQKTQVETAALLVQLHAQMAQIQAMLAGGAPPQPGPGLVPPGAPPPAPSMMGGGPMPPSMAGNVPIGDTGLPEGVGPV